MKLRREKQNKNQLIIILGLEIDQKIDEMIRFISKKILIENNSVRNRWEIATDSINIKY